MRRAINSVISREDKGALKTFKKRLRSFSWVVRAHVTISSHLTSWLDIHQILSRTYRIRIYRASVWFFTGMSPDVDDKHVLGLERFLLSRAVLPLAHKLFLALSDVVGV